MVVRGSSKSPARLIKAEYAIEIALGRLAIAAQNGRREVVVSIVVTMAEWRGHNYFPTM